MVDERALAELFSVEAGVFSIATILGLMAWRIWNGLPNVMAQWIEWRKAKAAEKSKDWTRLRDEIDRLWAECRELRKSVQECEEREGEWMRRAIQAEAMAMGQGEARQAAAVAVAEMRVDTAQALKKLEERDEHRETD